MLARSLFSVYTLLSIAEVTVAQQYTTNAESGFSALQKWYNASSGLWDSTGWWNSANCLTVVGDLAAVNPTMKSTAMSVMSNTFENAQKYNLQMAKVVEPNFMVLTVYGEAVFSTLGIGNMFDYQSVNPKGFINDYYDDEGWWAHAWIQAYDVTGNQDYLTMAEDIFEDMKNGSETRCGGGIWWDKPKTYVNAIANELYLSAGAHLANRASNKDYYLNLAKNQWTWFQNSGMINPDSTIADGLTNDCENNNGTVWSYNQGVILGGLVELTRATGDRSYLTTANRIASAAISKLSVNNVLHDVCDPDCGADGNQFKGVFMRNLQKLQQASPSQNYLTFISNNANSIWNNDRNSQNQFGDDWAGPYSTATAATQSSAMDALVAAVAVSGEGITSYGYEPLMG